jgi:hypothetical protein
MQIINVGTNQLNMGPSHCMSYIACFFSEKIAAYLNTLKKAVFITKTPINIPK